MSEKFRNLEAAYDWLNGHIHYERCLDRVEYDTRQFNLDAFRKRLVLLGSPQDKLRTLHIAGTRGKGSSALLLESLLQASGLKTAVFTSPHLSEYRERIRIDGRVLDSDSFVRLLGQIARKMGPLTTKSRNFMTVFEHLTTLFFCAADESHVDWAVIETGLGGRLDATNIIKPGPVLLTRIGLEHSHLLGDTIEKIAAEKAAILKVGGWAVSSDQHPNNTVMEVFRDHAAQQDQAELHEATRICAVKSCEARSNGLMLDFEFEGRELKLSMNLLGTYQVENVQNALAILGCFRQRGLIRSIKDSAIKNALERVRLPGRMQLFGEDPQIIIDPAHCVTGATALVRSLKGHFGNESAHLAVAMMRDKNHDAYFRALSAWGGWQHIWCFQSDTPRSMSSRELATVARKYFKDVSIVHTTSDMFKLIQKNTEKMNRVVVTGSIFHLGQFIPVENRNHGKHQTIGAGTNPEVEQGGNHGDS